MKMQLLFSLALAGALAVSASPAHADIVAGVDGAGSAPLAPPPGTPIVRGACDVFIDFDDAAQPCVFLSTVALRTTYSGLGVSFTGTGPLDGGAILDECSSFGVSGHSSPNFLAFNCTAQMSDGGIPDAPETLTFSPAVAEVSILVGSGLESTTVSLSGYDSGGGLVDSDAVLIGSAMQLLSISGSGIVTVILGSSSNCMWVADDLCYSYGGPNATEGTSWGKIKDLFR